MSRRPQSEGRAVGQRTLRTAGDPSGGNLPR